jgi:hypothetical protein
VVVEAGEGVEAGGGAAGAGAVRRRVRDIYGLCQSRQDCSELNFIAFLNDSAVASAPELDGLTTSLIELMAPRPEKRGRM